MNLLDYDHLSLFSPPLYELEFGIEFLVKSDCFLYMVLLLLISMSLLWLKLLAFWSDHLLLIFSVEVEL